MEKTNDENKALFQSLHILKNRWKDGTFGEILDDWRWIFQSRACWRRLSSAGTAVSISRKMHGETGCFAGR